jgi:RNA 3'-terminal phosphate cyclase (ATP)
VSTAPLKNHTNREEITTTVAGLGGMNPIEIDGSLGEGGGQILRTAISLASILGNPIRITNIRARRKEPGLRPQHLEAISAASQLCNGILRGTEIGSRTVEYAPGNPDKKKGLTVDTRTAGSVSLIAQTIIPIAACKGIEVEARLIGGTEVNASPTVDYLQRVVKPLYSLIGWNVSIEIKKRGYYPKGGGTIILRVNTPNSRIRCIDLLEENYPRVRRASILSVSRMLPEHVSERQLESAKNILSSAHLEIEAAQTDSRGDSLSPGSSILISHVSANRFIGSTALGQRGKRAEMVGEEAAREFLNEEGTGANVDSHLADMLVTMLACSEGESRYSTSNVTEHLRTNLEVAKLLAGCSFTLTKTARGNWIVTLSSSADKSI